VALQEIGLAEPVAMRVAMERLCHASFVGSTDSGDIPAKLTFAGRLLLLIVAE
jgi:hypothetical protein